MCSRIGSDLRKGENEPRNTAENLRNLDGHYTLCSKEDCREGNNERETSHDSVAVAEAFRDVAIDEEADNFTAIGTVA